MFRTANNPRRIYYGIEYITRVLANCTPEQFATDSPISPEEFLDNIYSNMPELQIEDKRIFNLFRGLEDGKHHDFAYIAALFKTTPKDVRNRYEKIKKWVEGTAARSPYRELLGMSPEAIVFIHKPTNTTLPKKELIQQVVTQQIFAFPLPDNPFEKRDPYAIPIVDWIF
jgi:hypothetical protein